MGFKLVKENYSYTFKFEGDSHAVDASNLSLALASTSKLLSLIQDVKYPNSKTSLSIKPFKEGSFVVESIVTVSLASNIISMISMAGNPCSVAKDIFESLVIILDLKKHLQDTPKENVELNKIDNSINISNVSGNVFVIDNKNIHIVEKYLIDEDLDRNCSKLFQAVLDEDGDGCSFSDNEKSKKFSKEECSKLSHPSMAIKFEDSEVEETRIVSIQIRRPDVVGNSKWSIIYNGTTINVTIVDKDFLHKFQSGQIVFKKDNPTSVKMKLKIKKRFDGTVKEYDHEIIEVLPDIIL